MVDKNQKMSWEDIEALFGIELEKPTTENRKIQKSKEKVLGSEKQAQIRVETKDLKPKVEEPKKVKPQKVKVKKNEPKKKVKLLSKNEGEPELTEFKPKPIERKKEQVETADKASENATQTRKELTGLGKPNLQNLKEGIIWSEILGEPKSRTRRSRSLRYRRSNLR